MHHNQPDKGAKEKVGVWDGQDYQRGEDEDEHGLRTQKRRAIDQELTSKQRNMRGPAGLQEFKETADFQPRGLDDQIRTKQLQIELTAQQQILAEDALNNRSQNDEEEDESEYEDDYYNELKKQSLDQLMQGGSDVELAQSEFEEREHREGSGHVEDPGVPFEHVEELAENAVDDRPYEDNQQLVGAHEQVVDGYNGG